MSKDQKSMDEVLASIRKIIRTDPTAAPPDIGTAPGGGLGDETAREVLDKLRRQSEGDDRQSGTPLSTSDDPDEAARAVLDHLRRQAEAEAKKELKRPATPATEEPAPELGPTPEEPPAVAANVTDVPDLEKEPAPGAEGDGQDDDALELGADAGGRVMEPKSPPAPEPELPQPPAQGERREREAPVMVDEAALEAMIRRVVRDELMGEMGRRVTQNVVKLIRTEVARSRLEEK